MLSCVLSTLLYKYDDDDDEDEEHEKGHEFWSIFDVFLK